MRRAGRELLSLALIDARNHTLHLLSLYEQALAQGRLAGASRPERRIAAGLAGRPYRLVRGMVDRPQHAARVRRGLPGATHAAGRRSSRRPTSGGILRLRRTPMRWPRDLPDLGQTKAYLLDTLESTLELLEHAAEDDAGLYFFRLALFHEDLRGEQLVVMAQTLGLPLELRAARRALQARDRRAAARDALALGSVADGGFAFAQEAGARDRGARIRDRCPARDLGPVRGVRRRRRLRPARVLAARGLGMAGARPIEGRRGPRHVEQIGAARHGTGGSVLQTPLRTADARWPATRARCT